MEQQFYRERLRITGSFSCVSVCKGACCSAQADSPAYKVNTMMKHIAFKNPEHGESHYVRRISSRLHGAS